MRQRPALLLTAAMIVVKMAVAPAFAFPGQTRSKNGKHDGGGFGGGDVVNPDNGNHLGKIKHGCGITCTLA